jgi:hypothetical protein
MHERTAKGLFCWVVVIVGWERPQTQKDEDGERGCALNYNNYLALPQSPILGSGHSHPQPITLPKIYITNINLPVTCPHSLVGDQIARQKFPIADGHCTSAPFLPSAQDIRPTRIIGYTDLSHGKLGIIFIKCLGVDNLTDATARSPDFSISFRCPMPPSVHIALQMPQLLVSPSHTSPNHILQSRPLPHFYILWMLGLF